MEFSQTAEEVAKLLARAIRAELTEDRDTYFFAIRGLESRAPVCLTIHRAELDALIAQLQQKSFSDQMVLHDDLYFEAIVQEEAPIPSRLTREGLLNVADRESGFEYEVSPLSNEYLVRLLAFAADSRSLRDLTSFPIFRHRALRLLESESVPDLLDFVRGSFARYSTLKIRVTSAQSLRRFNQAARTKRDRPRFPVSMSADLLNYVNRGLPPVFAVSVTVAWGQGRIRGQTTVSVPAFLPKNVNHGRPSI